MISKIFQWSDSYSVGHHVLDAQHKKLLELCCAVDQLSPADPAYSTKFHDILHEICQYAKVHFTTEETILNQSGYPHIRMQKEDHHSFVDKLSDILYDSSFGSLDHEKVRHFLQEWWIEHITVSDMEYKHFLKQS